MDDTTSLITVAAQTTNILMLELAESPEKNRKNSGNKVAKRSPRRRFKNGQALQAIKRDYLGLPEDPSTPLFAQDFKLMFRLSRPRFELLVRTTCYYQNEHSNLSNLLRSQKGDFVVVI